MWVRAASLFGIFLSHLAFLTASHAQLPPANATYTLRGTVVNSVTGEPIQRVLVQLEGNRQRRMLTGADGKFEFQNIPAGIMNIGLQKPGYFPEQAIRSRPGRATFVTVGPNQPATVLKLVPEAVISGRVLGDGGEPVESLPVQAFGEQFQNGKKTWNSIGNAQTDDQGEFRLADLQPGRYYVFAGPSSWPASFAPQARVQTRARLRALGGGRPAARGYPGVFYPAAEDRNSATPLQVRAGQHVEVNFNVASQIFHTISGTVSGYPVSDAGLNLELTNAVGGQIGANINFDLERGTFKTQWLPPGRYTLSAETRDNQGHASYASQEVNLTSDLTGVHLQLLPAPTIPVNFQVERTNTNPQQMGSLSETRMGIHGVVHLSGSPPAGIALNSAERSFSQLHSPPRFASQLVEGGDSAIEVAGVSPGVYSLEIYPNGPLYVASARCGSVNLLEQDLTIAAGAAVQPIEIVLRDNYATLTGKVRLAGRADSALVLAIPEAGGQRIQTAQVSLPPPGFGGGESWTTFAFQLPPGPYRILAVDPDHEFEYGDPEVLRKYADEAREVAAVANQKTEIELELVHVED